MKNEGCAWFGLGLFRGIFETELTLVGFLKLKPKPNWPKMKPVQTNLKNSVWFIWFIGLEEEEEKGGRGERTDGWCLHWLQGIQ